MRHPDMDIFDKAAAESLAVLDLLQSFDHSYHQLESGTVEDVSTLVRDNIMKMREIVVKIETDQEAAQ